MPDLTTTIAAITGLTSLIGRITDQKLKMEFQGIIIDLQKEVMEMQARIMSLQADNDRLKRASEAEASIPDLLKQYHRKGNAYWKDGRAYCVKCLEGGDPRTLVQINRYAGSALCPNCNSRYADVFPHETPHAPMVVG